MMGTMDYSAQDMRTAEPSMAKMQDRATVFDALEGYDKLLSVLESVIDRHRERISAVMAPSEPSPAPNGAMLASAGRPNSDLTNRIYGLNERLHILANGLDAMTSRVEL